MSTVVIAPELRKFLAAVRSELADLDPEEQREITDGLVADLSDLVEDQGVQALGDPVAYATELRQAAGLGVGSGSRPGPGRLPALRQLPDAVLDAVTERWHRLRDALPGDVAGLLLSLQPVWWVLRGYIAVQSALLGSGGWSLSVVPDHSIDGGLITLVVIAASVQLGRGRLPVVGGWTRHAAYRLVLVALNLLAVVMVPPVLNGFEHARSQSFENGYAQGLGASGDGSTDPGTDRAGMYVDGTWISAIYPYDAQGRPLVGVQLFNQIGQPINLTSEPECVYDDTEQPTDQTRVYFPWSDGASTKHNVFPVPSRIQDSEAPEVDASAFSSADPPRVSGFPFVRVPKVSLPGLLTSTGITPPKSYVAGPRTGPINSIFRGC